MPHNQQPPAEKPSRPQTIAVDFDGVIHQYSRGWQDGTIYDPPMPGAIDSLRILMDTYAVFIHTTRDATTVAAWLAERGFDTVVDIEGPKHPKREFWNEQGALLVTNRKLPAVAYIDDRAIRFQSWKQALADMERPPYTSIPTYEKLLTALEGLVALHRRNEHTGECEYCSARDYPDYAAPWPCETLRALKLDYEAKV
ncbi:hypothetical protein [Streptomyces griseorubiginosus]|uniref:hypothetical protein n=1 Tax=Streptomyces griseorubiginosus TaxID=67304 RepID=UPI0033E21496